MAVDRRRVSRHLSTRLVFSALWTNQRSMGIASEPPELAAGRFAGVLRLQTSDAMLSGIRHSKPALSSLIAPADDWPVLRRLIKRRYDDENR
jgi:hypothetical protein